MESTPSYQLAINKASAFCSRSEKCKADVITYLENWGLPEEDIHHVIEYLIKERFIDEERYANYFVHDKFYLNKWGKYKITYMLRMKRISDRIISDSIDKIPQEDYEKNIRNILLSKAKSLKGSSLIERKSKLINYAQSKGFETDLAFRIAEEILSGE